MDRLIVAMAALVCLVFVNRLVDTRLRLELPPPLPPAPPVPESIQRDAKLRVTVVDENDKPFAGASVRVFAMRDEKAYFGGDRDTDASGVASFDRLPRGEAWVLAYGAGRSRASTKAVLDATPKEARLVLHPAKALDVIVVGDEDRPVEGCRLELRSADPLPYVATTDATGAARLDRLGPPPYSIKASAQGYDDTTRTGLVPGPSPVRIQLDHLATMDVLVVADDDKPVPNATVLASGTGLWPARSTTTDASGKARIGGLRGGVYDLKAREGERVSKTDLAVPLKRGETKDVKLTLLPGRMIAITVTDGDAEKAPPVKDASVVLVEDGLSSFPLLGKTDAKGNVSLGPIAKTSARVSARAKGFVPKSASIDPDAKEARIALERGAIIEGEVVDDRGYPIAGATLEVVGVDAEGMPIDETTAMSEFRDDAFATALPGPRPLVPMGELGVMPGPVPDIPRGDSTSEAPEPASRGGDPWVSRGDGTFVCEPVTPGRLHVIARHPGYVESLSDLVQLAPGAKAHVRIVLREGGFLEGRVLEEETRRPVSGARVELAATKGWLERVTYAADDGTFTFAAVPEEVLLSVARPETPSEIAARAIVEVPDRDRKRIEILLPKVRDSVKVRVSDDRGFAVDKVEVQAVSLDVAVPLKRTLFTDANGDCEIPDALGLPLRFILTRPSKAPHVEEIESAPREVKLTMNEGVRGAGEVTARNGHEHVEGAEVTLFAQSGARHTRTDADGAFHFDDLAEGRARIVVKKSGLARAEVVLKISGDRNHPADLGKIELPEAGEVEGEVVDSHDDGIAGARVAEGGVPTYLPMGPLPSGIVLTDREGRFTLAGLREGSLTLEAYFAELGRGSVENVEVRAGRTTRRIKIVLPGGADVAKEPKGAGSVAVTLGERDRKVVVVVVPEGSEAEAAGIEPGDVIVSVNGTGVRSIESARKKLTGPLSEDVVLGLSRVDATGSSSWLARVRRERVRR